MKLITIKQTDSNKHINIKDINKGPPSLKRSTNCEEIINLFATKETKSVIIMMVLN